MSTATGQATEIQMQNAGVEMHKLGNFSIVDCREVWIDAENDYTLATIAHSCPVEEMGSKDIRLRSNTTLGCGCCGTAADLILQLEAAKSQSKLTYYLSKVIAGSKLLIIDELGYVKFDAQQANLFFQLINKRYETGSIIITTNLSFLKWQEVLNNDEALTTATLDRLIHHSHILNINGDSYRLKQKKEAGILPFNSKLKPRSLNQG